MINKAILVGNVGQDPIVKNLSNGGKIVSFSLATSEKWKDKDGNQKDKTEWHKIVIFNNHLGQVAEKYIKKGSSLYIEGSIRNRKFTDNNNVERSTTEIVIQGFGDILKLLSGRNASSDNNGNYKESDNATEDSHVNEDDIPW